MLPIGTKVTVTVPTGGVLANDEFVVITKPADRQYWADLNYCEYQGGVDHMRPWTASERGRVMGFHDSSLTVVS